MLKIKKLFIVIISFMFLFTTSFLLIPLENNKRNIFNELNNEENNTLKGNDKEFEKQLDSMNDNQGYSLSNSVSAPPNPRPWKLAEGKRD